MNDVLYIGDIPEEYHYAQFNNYFVDLYNTANLLPNHTYKFYRVYLYDNYFAYDNRTRTLSSYSSGELAFDIPVSVNVNNRRDAPSIWLMIFFGILAICAICNIVTSMIRKGGILGGLW